MVIQLRSRHMLELGSVADVATELWAAERGVALELSEGRPHDLTSTRAPMWEFTKINTVSDNLVNLLKAVTSSLAIGAADVEVTRSFGGHLTSR